MSQKMQNNMQVQGQSDSPIGSYDLVLVACGFEARATFFARKLLKESNRKSAIGFTYKQTASYQSNKKWYIENNFDFVESTDADYDTIVRSKISEAQQYIRGSSEARIFVDISCLNRYRLATMLQAFVEVPSNVAMTVEFGYAIAKFQPAPIEQPANTYVGPVTPFFAGWSAASDLPPISIIGLGYEQDKALGAVERLQADEVWPILPRSPIKEYEGEVEKANQILLEATPPNRRMTYDVLRPLETYLKIDSLVHGSLQIGRPVLLPFGPKIFCLISLLIALSRPEVAVWRVSALEGLDDSDKFASGELAVLTVRFAK